jgi:hypothetical protein
MHTWAEENGLFSKSYVNKNLSAVKMTLWKIDCRCANPKWHPKDAFKITPCDRCCGCGYILVTCPRCGYESGESYHPEQVMIVKRKNVIIISNKSF